MNPSSLSNNQKNYIKYKKHLLKEIRLAARLQKITTFGVISGLRESTNSTGVENIKVQGPSRIKALGEVEHSRFKRLSTRTRKLAFKGQQTGFNHQNGPGNLSS